MTKLDETNFDFLNGLWKGKKPPFSKAVVIRNTNFRNDGRVDLSNVAVLDVERKQLEKRTLRNGDIIIERSGGGPKQPVGRVVYFENADPETDYSFSNFTSAIRVNNHDAFDSKYVFYFLHNFYNEGKTDRLQKRTTGIRNLDFSTYKHSVVFPSVSLGEQKEIARVLGTVQEAIAAQEDLIEKLKELKRSMMQHLFTHGTKGEKTKQTKIGEMPESWNVVRLGDYLQKTATKDPSKNPNQEFTYIDVSAVSREEFSVVVPQKMRGKDAPSRARKLVSAGDILFATVRPTLQRIAVVPVELNGEIASTGFCVIRPNSELSNQFLFHYLCTARVLEYVGEHQHGVSYPAIRDGVLFNAEVPLPHAVEQCAVAGTLDAIDEKIYAVGEKLAVYNNLFKTLLHELMSGECRVKTP